jgi:hypothetical protein
MPIVRSSPGNFLLPRREYHLSAVPFEVMKLNKRIPGVRTFYVRAEDETLFFLLNVLLRNSRELNESIVFT